jgi:phosphatidylserine/phosphatidylglycerophosphate/cardiolipin synthase-like enzyme
VDALDLYAKLVDKATREACVTLAFGIGANVKTLLKGHNPNDALTFLLLERKDAPQKNAKTPFVAINASNNVYKAWGSYIEDPVYHWTRETNTRKLGVNTHVAYIHSKFLLQDPLGADPIIVTGSANFSEASTIGNDENMLIIRGDASKRQQHGLCESRTRSTRMTRLSGWSEGR